jgi:uncharacterized protein YdaU (DUF1376 family)
MGKIPYIPLYIGDWEQDMNAVSLEAEGAWFKIICKMFKDEKSGIYKTSTKALQNLWKRDSKGVHEILNELKDNDICGLEIGEVITFTNRRMVREGKISEIRSKSVQKRYKKPTKDVQITEYENEIENENVIENVYEIKGGAGGNIINEAPLYAPPKVEVQRVFIQEGGTIEMAEHFYNKYQSIGWVLNGSPVKQWGYLVKNFIINWKKNNDGKNNFTSNARPNLPTELKGGF